MKEEDNSALWCETLKDHAGTGLTSLPTSRYASVEGVERKIRQRTSRGKGGLEIGNGRGRKLWFNYLAVRTRGKEENSQLACVFWEERREKNKEGSGGEKNR